MPAIIEFLYGDLAGAPERIGKPLQRELTGTYSARRGPYRILYEIDRDTFVLTVRQPLYTFVGVQNIPPPAGKTFTAGRSIPLGWKYQNGTTLVDSSTARFEVSVVGPLPNPTINNTDSGQSSFRYSSGTWSFNLQTKTPAGVPYPVGTYQVTVKSLTAGFPSSAPFTIQLVK